jgi:hypothetical protein
MVDESYAYAFLIGGFTLLYAWYKFTEWQEDRANAKRASAPSLLFFAARPNATPTHVMTLLQEGKEGEGSKDAPGDPGVDAL